MELRDAELQSTERSKANYVHGGKDGADSRRNGSAKRRRMATLEKTERMHTEQRSTERIDSTPDRRRRAEARSAGTGATWRNTGRSDTERQSPKRKYNEAGFDTKRRRGALARSNLSPVPKIYLYLSVCLRHLIGLSDFLWQRIKENQGKNVCYHTNTRGAYNFYFMCKTGPLCYVTLGTKHCIYEKVLGLHRNAGRGSLDHSFTAVGARKNEIYLSCIFVRFDWSAIEDIFWSSANVRDHLYC